MGYRVDRLDPATAEAAAVAILAGNFSRSAVERARMYRWWYFDRATQATSVFLLRKSEKPQARAPAAIGDDAVVGCAGVGSRTLYRNGRPVEAAVLVHFAVNREHRTLLPAMSLQRAVHAYVHATFELTYGFPNTQSVRIVERIGYLNIGQLARYARVLRHASYVERIMGRVPFVPQFAGAVLDLAALWIDRARARSTRGHATLEWLASFDERFNDLWMEARSAHAIIGVRDGDFLRWRFLERPGTPGEIAALIECRTGRLRAYAVVSCKDEVANIKDVLGRSDADVAALIRMLSSALRRRGLVAASIKFFGSRRFVDIIEAGGFRRRNESDCYAVVVDSGESLSREGPSALDPENWYLTEADEDT